MSQPNFFEDEEFIEAAPSFGDRALYSWLLVLGAIFLIAAIVLKWSEFQEFYGQPKL